MNVVAPPSQPPTTGRPRDPRIDDDILDVTEELLARDGYDALTIAAVADAAHVGRPTVYRRWPNKAHLVLASVARGAGSTGPIDTGTLNGDLVAIHHREVRLFNSSVYRNIVPALVARLASDELLADAYIREFVDRRRADLDIALKRAFDRRELLLLPDTDSVYDLLIGPLFYRAIIRRAPIEPCFSEQLVDAVLQTLTRSRRPRR